MCCSSSCGFTESNSTPSLAVSAKAAEQPRSHIRLREGSAIPVELAIRAIVVGSANDAAVTVAEAVGGSEGHFSEMMTAKARQLGMAHTFFHNATGLPDDLQQTTAEDIGDPGAPPDLRLPGIYGYFQTAQMNWRGEDYTTHNSLIGNYAGADASRPAISTPPATIWSPRRSAAAGA
ncbi:MAG: hypothetical protein WDN08_12890 [Rhizomicrobium sp.]